ncbi:hypothetical protein PLICRDRAFT_172423 [Plicaturopsis crispa FD-325 SS-3]|nr:hypothetical protein PLICRDRAFT_172423 [Plicaturopsis crispa FD-325 SS-3]
MRCEERTRRCEASTRATPAEFKTQTSASSLLVLAFLVVVYVVHDVSRNDGTPPSAPLQGVHSLSIFSYLPAHNDPRSPPVPRPGAPGRARAPTADARAPPRRLSDATSPSHAPTPHHRDSAPATTTTDSKHTGTPPALARFSTAPHDSGSAPRSPLSAACRTNTTPAHDNTAHAPVAWHRPVHPLRSTAAQSDSTEPQARRERWAPETGWARERSLARARSVEVPYDDGGEWLQRPQHSAPQ